MSLDVVGFPAAASVSLYRPKATPGVALPTAIATVAADAAGKASFADQTGGVYVAVAGALQIRRFVHPGYTPGENPPFVPL